MSEEEMGSAEGAPAEKKSMKLVLVLGLSTVIGAGVGGFVAAPMLVGGGAAAPAHEEAATGSHGRSSKSAPTLIHSIDNLVLNPRDTNGTRFLMVSAAFEFTEPAVQEQLRNREPEVRDLLIRTFGKRSVEELADLGQRESLREDIRHEMEAMLAAGRIQKVYLPQFVIQ